VDEAHKMSAHRYGFEVKKTQRYLLGELLGRITRHLLLMTATPHSGKGEDFELFMALMTRIGSRQAERRLEGSRRARADAPDG